MSARSHLHKHLRQLDFESILRRYFARTQFLKVVPARLKAVDFNVCARKLNCQVDQANQPNQTRLFFLAAPL